MAIALFLTLFCVAPLLFFTTTVSSEESQGVEGNSTITIDPRNVTGETFSPFVGVTLDWWEANDPRFGPNWGNAGILTLNLSEPNLIALASGLAPGYLRIGGSPEDSITYDTDGQCTPTPSFGARGSSSPYYCSQVEPAVYGCLSMDRMAQILEFAKNTGLRLIFGLNACYGRNSSTSPMDFTNTKALLSFIAQSPYATYLYGFELGNELTSTVDPATWARDFSTLSDLISELWPSPSSRPLLFGPDSSTIFDFYKEFVTTLEPGVLDAVTYHQYPNCLPDLAGGQVLPLDCLAAIDSIGISMKALTNAYGLNVVAGETSEHSGGGIPNVTNVFVSSFYYSYQLGALSSIGVSAAFRQCLIGGYYELINKTTYLPNPDYYIALMFHRLVSNLSISAITTNAPNSFLHATAHCASESPGVVILTQNFGNISQVVSFDLVNATVVEEAQLYSFTGDLFANVVSLNGVVLQFVNGELPPMVPVPVWLTEAVSIPAQSVNFIYQPGVACGSV